MQEKLIKDLKSTTETSVWNSSYNDRLHATFIQKQESIVVGSKIDKSVSEFLEAEYNLTVSCSSESRMPHYPMPNAGSYSDRPEAWNWISALFGIYTRTAHSSSTKIGWFNGESNYHIKYRLRYLGHLRDNNRNVKYWTQGFKLMKNPAFQRMAYNKVNSGWYKNSSQNRVEQELREIAHLVSTEAYKIDFKRVYIPKSDGSNRPLGVPTLPWRVYLNMINTLIVWYDINSLDSQHAYSPGRGTYTVWKEIYSKIHAENNIYEFDLSKYFDKVDLNYNNKELENMGVPENVRNFLTKLNQSIVTLKEEDLLDESDNRKVIFNSDNTLNPNLPDTIKNQLNDLNNIEAPHHPVIATLLNLGYTLLKMIGVPQGAATSCSLSKYNLKHLFRYLKGLVMYADDGLVFPKNSTKEPNLNSIEAGIHQNPTKSGWVKKDSTWIKALKFCGLVYIPENIPYNKLEKTTYPRLMAATRNGSKLEFTVKEQFLCYLNEIYINDLKKYAKHDLFQKNLDIGKYTIGEWIENAYKSFSLLKTEERLGLLFTSKMGPMIMASLYNNSWQLSELSDKKLHFTKKSWISIGYANYLYNLFPGKAATYLKLKKQALKAEFESLTSRVQNLKEIKLDPKLYQNDIERITVLTRQLDLLKKGINFMLHNITPSMQYNISNEDEELLSNGVELTEEDKKLKTQAFKSLFKLWNDSDKSLVNQHDKDTKLKYLEYRKCWKQILVNFFKLDMSNVSTYAAHNMLTGLNSRSTKVKFCKVLTLISKHPKLAKELFNESKSSKKRRSLLKRKRENNLALKLF